MQILRPVTVGRSRFLRSMLPRWAPPPFVEDGRTPVRTGLQQREFADG